MSIEALVTQYGPMGLFLAYLILRDTKDDKLRKERVAADRQLAAALATLTTTINLMIGKHS